tara:strand:+ start:10615 stop:11211 length:597 start_codon:yes stop_codon:yes gene_type:complete
MIIFKRIPNEEPFLKFKEYYDLAFLKKQKSIDALAISSLLKDDLTVDSRYVNLKMIDDGKLIFFSNYESRKANQFNSHNTVSALIYWNNINIQIRIKGKISKTTDDFNQKYFSKRDIKKNSLAISSKQSEYIKSFEEVKLNYRKSLENDDLTQCPSFWGGYAIKPFYIEFWKGDTNRCNLRTEYSLNNLSWVKRYLQP